jgi:SAM-dependent methyltransferase
MSVIRKLYRTLSLCRWDNPPRLVIDQFVANISRDISKGSRVLDAGAGECTYASAFAHCNYVSCDRAIGDPAWDYRGLSVIADVAALPFKRGTFDAVLCTQVLEHSCEPLSCCQQMAGLLRPGGRVYLTVPFLGDPLHQEPYDFYRYTKHALRHLLQDAGLSPLDISPIGGLPFLLCCYFWWFFLICDQWDLRGDLHNPPRRTVRLLVRTALLLWARFCAMLVIFFGVANILSQKFTYGYTVVGEKSLLVKS